MTVELSFSRATCGKWVAFPNWNRCHRTATTHSAKVRWLRAYKRILNFLRDLVLLAANALHLSLTLKSLFARNLCVIFLLWHVIQYKYNRIISDHMLACWSFWMQRTMWSVCAVLGKFDLAFCQMIWFKIHLNFSCCASGWVGLVLANSDAGCCGYRWSMDFGKCTILPHICEICWRIIFIFIVCVEALFSAAFEQTRNIRAINANDGGKKRLFRICANAAVFGLDADRTMCRYENGFWLV